VWLCASNYVAVNVPIMCVAYGACVGKVDVDSGERKWVQWIPLRMDSKIN
jgi:hypothetical protein